RYFRYGAVQVLCNEAKFVVRLDVSSGTRIARCEPLRELGQLLHRCPNGATHSPHKQRGHDEAEQDRENQCAARSARHVAEVEDRCCSAGLAPSVKCNAYDDQHCDAGPESQHRDCRTQSRFHAFLQPNSAESFQLSFSFNFKLPDPDKLPVHGSNPKSAQGDRHAATGRCSAARSPVGDPECFPIPPNMCRSLRLPRFPAARCRAVLAGEATPPQRASAKVLACALPSSRCQSAAQSTLAN